MTAWHVWTDGSCMHGLARVPRGLGGWGGWAAIVEHGPAAGVVVRGRVPDTTAVRMELRAAIEGLRAVDGDARAVLHTDCMTVAHVHYRWAAAIVGDCRGPDACLWLELDEEMERVGDVELSLVVKGHRDPVHRRAHVIAGAEARGGLRNLPINAVPLDPREDRHRLRKHLQAQAFTDRPVHAASCRPGLCVASCPVWLEHGALVYRSRRNSEARR